MKMIRWPKLYQGKLWHGGLWRYGLKQDAWVINELWDLIRTGKYHFGWQWPELVFGAGRDWYDGPIWYLHLGICSLTITFHRFFHR